VFKFLDFFVILAGMTHLSGHLSKLARIWSTPTNPSPPSSAARGPPLSELTRSAAPPGQSWSAPPWQDLACAALRASFPEPFRARARLSRARLRYPEVARARAASPTPAPPRPRPRRPDLTCTAPTSPAPPGARLPRPRACSRRPDLTPGLVEPVLHLLWPEIARTRVGRVVGQRHRKIKRKNY
jgi:hypothetical protein